MNVYLTLVTVLSTRVAEVNNSVWSKCQVSHTVLSTLTAISCNSHTKKNPRTDILKIRKLRFVEVNHLVIHSQMFIEYLLNVQALSLVLEI